MTASKPTLTAEQKAELLNVQYQLARAGEVPLLIHLGLTEMGQVKTEKVIQEHQVALGHLSLDQMWALLDETRNQREPVASLPQPEEPSVIVEDNGPGDSLEPTQQQESSGSRPESTEATSEADGYFELPPGVALPRVSAVVEAAMAEAEKRLGQLVAQQSVADKRQHLLDMLTKPTANTPDGVTDPFPLPDVWKPPLP
jgi:hypothetical protein